MPETLVQAARDGDCLVATLSRPDDGNAINLAMARELAALVDACGADRSLRSLVITGAGPRFFCTGGDVKAYAQVDNAAALDAVFDLIRGLLDAIESLHCPVIAAINGYAIGGGAELALACDLRVMEAGAQIGFPQARLGILPGWDGISRLLPLVGRGAANRLLLSGKRITAAEALAIGLIDEVAPAGTSLARALALGRELAEAAPLSQAAIKAALRDAAGSDAAGARQRAREAMARLWFSADHKEAERAFAEKRAPRFTGA
ncbi:MAG: enoyl-CoA hydratase/isomerase family protein [Burkholderiales bacterium]|nr:enoyl-CoA hydratase/isomerase family protein [Burkholderiales bacterium]